MRYAAETEQMERDGPPERPEDWDSLSDRIRKSRLKPKTLLQQQKEAILGDRKDALTKRPLDFDREEETRKGETMKWLESHFGSESTTSSDSRDEDVEPTKKSYFNVTIKSNQNQNGNTSTLTRPSPTKAVVPQEPLPSPITTKPQTQQLSQQNGKTKYFQGISNWADRRESTPKQLVTKAFKDELSGTLERSKNLRQLSSSRDDVRYGSRTNKPADTYVTKEEIMQQKRNHYNNFGSRTDLRHRRQSRDDSGDELKKEDLGYLSGSRTDLRRDRRDSNEEAGARKAHNLKREDSGYVKDSREDVRSSLLREEESNSKISNGKSIIQRDDSAYISSSTNFTEPHQRLPKTSPPRAPSPEFQGRPSVPQRRRVIEKKLRQSSSNNYSPPSPVRNADRSEPPPDYSPPPRSSRSRSPPAIIIPPAPAPPMSGTLPSALRKSNQRTRFASESSSKPTASTQTQTTPPKSGSKVSQAIGNSLRKLVGKIRSASADRKFRMKSKSKSRDRSPSPQNNGYNSNGPNSTTYQQYNVIDSHISGGSSQQQHHQQQPTSVLKSSKSAPLNRESSIISSSMTNGRGADRRGSSDLDIMANGSANPKQRYYLGEDPYGGSSFGKENKYDKNGKLQQQQQQQYHRRREGSSDELNPRETYVRQQPNLSSSNTLGRYQKSYNTSTSNYYNNRLGSTPNLGADYDYRSAQTLPRKLDHSNQNGSNSYFQNRPPQHHSSTINVSIVNQVKSQPLQNTGPAKPARMYSSRPQLNRSKSFNVHGLNGTNDPNPIFIGKSRNNYNRSDTMYKSNPALYHSSSQHQDTFANGLKSPSIVNLISRSQKDLTRIGEEDPPVDFRKEKRMSHSRPTDKKDLFLKGLQDQAPELYRTIHGGSASPVVNGRHYKHPSSSLGSRSPIEINKDTASIIRRGSSSTETDYTETYKYTTKSDDPKRPTVTNTVQSFTKKTVPTKDGRGMETIHSQEKRSVTTSRFKNEPISNLKYYDDRRRRSGSSSHLGGGGTTVIEVRRK